LLLTSGRETHEAGDVIVKEGSHGSAVYVVSSGKVEISKMVQGKKVVLDILGPGDVFGEMSYLDPAPRSATVIALEDTVLELLDRNFLDREFNQISSDFRGILCSVVRRLRKTTQSLAYSPRRSEERARAKIKVSFKHTGDFINGYIDNIGSGGLFIKTTEPLPVGTLVDLEFNLPQTDQIVHSKARVIWTRPESMSTEKVPPGMGTEFIDMDPKERELLKRYLALLRSGRVPVP
jgi:CRP/FNR family cyclic AMP-dependent transcriptional regulator